MIFKETVPFFWVNLIAFVIKFLIVELNMSLSATIEKFSVELLAVMDSLDAALAVENVTLENFRNGVELTHKQLTNVFEKFNIKAISPVGEKFDPHQHQAMCMVESELPANTVTQVMQRGYLLFDRVIRPAMVAVSKNQEGT